ncbi:MFS transporter [Mycobacterium montefiorense]|uniref:MFS transporter n=1 Tax=Mycobacterium montefiorense TaxID=154654 RepID=UPI0021DE4551|nr:MFS transporter [Mycobacterium montefiorense]MCV7429503.1 MFS transporter [Mycobacterium montefiorense]GLE54100.1 permease [Mycobacterium montefiorense]
MLFAAVLAILLATGWAANHFAGLIPVLSDRQHLSRSTVDAIFGIYAVGLLPGLLVGGRVSDLLGRQSVAWAGSITSLAGTVAMLLSQHSAVLLGGRLVVGAGVGLVISSCTAWASDMKGPGGAAVAGAVLTAGFAIGPFASGVMASVVQSGLWESFGVAAALVVLATVVAVVAAQRAAVTAPVTAAGGEQSVPVRQDITRALSWALPLSPWVYSSATLAFITIPAHVHTGLAAPIAAGTAALIANGISGLTQLVARARRWGPQAGTSGAMLAALGFAVTAAVPSTMPLGVGLSLLVILGCASGLLLREGLIDLEAAAPQRLRGVLTGTFYTVSYLGFGLPMLLSTVESGAADTTILAVMAALALTAAVSRAIRLRRNSHRQS